jgi:hypothetical protein
VNDPTHRRSPRSVALPLTALVAAITLAGCGGGSGHSSAPTTDPAVPTTRLSPVTPGGPEGAVVTVPTEKGVRPIQSYIDLGTQIIITPSGFEPRILESNDYVPLTWTNLTTSVQVVTFTSPPYPHIGPAVIPPGGKWHYTDNGGGALHFVNRYGDTGVVDFS